MPQRDVGRLVGNALALRRAERRLPVSEDLIAVREDLERQIGPSLKRGTVARLLGISQTALDRWVDSGDIATTVTVHGRREIPAPAFLDLLERVEDARARGHLDHPLAEVVHREREHARKTRKLLERQLKRWDRQPSEGHEKADLNSLLLHWLVARRLDERAVVLARRRLDELARAGRLDPRYAERWRELLAQPLPQIAAAIVEDTQSGRDLRQNTPMPRLISEHERRQVLDLVA